LRALRTLDDVEFNFVALFEGLVSFELDRAVVNEDIRSSVPSEKAKAFGVIEPFDLTLVLSHSNLLLPLSPQTHKMNILKKAHIL